MIGPPGSGKSMLAKRMPTILPSMSRQESLETTKIHSACGLISNQKQMITQRPYRSPHHTTSNIALVGGGSNPKAGEVTLSHNGVLFLDELPEFNRSVLETLRQPLEDQCVTIARASRTLQFPSSFMLIGAMNPCPCGQFTDQGKKCQCSIQQIQKYLSKISGPLLDRIDIQLHVPSLPIHQFTSEIKGEASCEIKKRTETARAVQNKRFKNSSTNCNAHMSAKEINASCYLSVECQSLLKQAIEELELSARAHDKILKVSRTIADLDQSEEILEDHIAEAISYRNLDRTWWM